MSTALRTLAALALPLALAAALPATAAPVPWLEQPEPNIESREEVLKDISVVSETDAWAAGYHWGFVGSILQFLPYVARWDGSGQWQLAMPPFVEGAVTTLLDGIDATPDGLVWTVGYSRASGSISRPLAAYWDGSAWTHTTPPEPGPAGNFLSSVAIVSPTNVWAVGNAHSISSTGSRGLALRWNGSSWTEVPLSGLDFCLRDTYLTDVAVRGARNVLVTGYCYTAGSQNQGFLLRRTGNTWQLDIGPHNLALRSELMAATWATRDVAWAAGGRHGDRSSEPVIFRFDGNAWVEEPAAGVNGTITDITATTRQRAFAGGIADSSQPPFAGRLILRRAAGGSWLREPAGDFGSINGIGGTRSGVLWGVGQNIDRALIVKRATPLPPP